MRRNVGRENEATESHCNNSSSAPNPLEGASQSSNRETSQTEEVNQNKPNDGEPAGANATSNKPSSNRAANFECYICLNPAEEPVVTRCGHLFCWSCIVEWMETGANECPVCKGAVTEDTITTIYGRGMDSSARMKDRRQSRPRAVRVEPPRRQSSVWVGGFWWSFESFGMGSGAYDPVNLRRMHSPGAEFRNATTRLHNGAEVPLDFVSPLLLLLGLVLTSYLLII